MDLLLDISVYSLQGGLDGHDDDGDDDSDDNDDAIPVQVWYTAFYQSVVFKREYRGLSLPAGLRHICTHSAVE